MTKYFNQVCNITDWSMLRNGDIVQFTYMPVPSRKLDKVRSVLLSKGATYKFMFLVAGTRVVINVFPESLRISNMVLLQRRYSPRKMNFLFDKVNVKI